MTYLLAVLLSLNKPKALYSFAILFVLSGLVLGSVYLTRYCKLKMREYKTARSGKEGPVTAKEEEESL
jgi:hypothetical protein